MAMIAGMAVETTGVLRITAVNGDDRGDGG
jgi:hypothetical protein